MSAPLTARIAEEHVLASRALAPPPALAARRRAALAALAAQGLPTSRDENWKYANLRPLERLKFAPAPVQRALAAADLPAAIPGFARYVFVDVARAESEEGASYPRVELRLESGTQLTLIERHVSAGAAASFVNSAVTVGLARGAALEHYRLQELAPRAIAFDTLSAALAEQASY